MTQALDRQIATAADQISLALRDLPVEHHIDAFMLAMEDRGDAIGSRLEELGNEVARHGHMLSRMAAPVTPLEPIAMIEDHGPIVMAAE